MDMSFHNNLIKTIKSNDHQTIYLLLDQIIEKQDSNMKKIHLDLLLSFLGSINDHVSILKYYIPLINIYKSNNWKQDLSSYPIIIRILCNIDNISNAIEYLDEMNKYKIPIKTRTIAPILENLSKHMHLELDDFKILVNLFDKYNKVFTLEQFHHLLIAFKKHKLTNNNVIIEKIKVMFSIWTENDFILNNDIIQLLLEWFPHYKSETFNEIDLPICSRCNNQLKKHQLTFNDRKILINDILSVYTNTKTNNQNQNQKQKETIKSRNTVKQNNINILQQFKSVIETERNLNVINKQIIIIDGGNMGHSENGEFSSFPIINFISSMKTSNVFILLILHQSRSIHFKDYIIDHDKLMIYYTPYNENDDMYWLLAGFMIKNSWVITNDLMRDHHVDKLDEVLFKRWKDNHIVSYSGFNITKPSLYTIGVQEHLEGWHIPLFNSNNLTIKWICLDKQ
jgi:hypothetical protein